MSSTFEESETVMPKLHAQPYDISATGFYFDTAEEYRQKADKAVNSYGDPVEEFEIQFIDGDYVDVELAKAWGLNQADLARYFDAAEKWDDMEKLEFIIAVGECGYSFDPDSVAPSDFDVTIYHEENLQDLAVQFVEEGLFGDVPESLRFYIDYEAIARDLGFDYTETTIAGYDVVYQCH